MMEKLSKSDVRLIVVCAVIIVISVLVVQRYFRIAFPEAAIEFELTREQAAERARGYVASRGWDVKGHRHASRFEYDNEEKTFLERQRNAEEAGRVFGEVNGWRWANRWFKPGEKEEFRVDFSTSGAIAFFEHVVAENAPGDSLARDIARDIAEFYLAGRLDWDASKWELVSAETERLEKRHDHEFVWKERGFHVDGGTHRVRVRVQGDEVGLYDEWIEVPDTWRREYDLIRSKNNLAGNLAGVLLYFTTMLLIVTLFVRARRKDVRWKAAWLFGGVVAVLFLLQALNQISSTMFFFDTKDSYASFLFTTIILGGLLIAPIAGFSMSVLLAGAEPLYRERYPHQIAFRHMLSARGLRTRSFLRSAVVGISLTFFFLAYQAIFYLIANGLGGWSPTEVKNINALATPLPWVAVLMGGLLPAISEESISRMFTIPFLQKHARSTFVAVLLGAVIWGFGHSTYPAQPFYIRGIEVSIGGIMIGYVFLRYGFLAVLIWHFSVDAVYSAAVLVQSGNAYYVTTGIVSAGVIALPLVYAVTAAIRNRGFVPATDLINARDVEAVSVAEVKVAAADKAKLPPAYVPLSAKTKRVGAAIAGLGVVLIAVTLPMQGPHLARFDTRQAEATAAARAYLDPMGFDLTGYRSLAAAVQDLGDGRGGTAHAHHLGGSRIVPTYLVQRGGQSAIEQVYPLHMSPVEWRVRFFKPLEKTEYNVYVDGGTGNVSGLSFELPDSVALPSLDQDAALALARGFLAGLGRELGGFEVADRRTEERENRSDHTFQFQTKADIPAGAGDARLVYNVTIHGDHVGAYNADVKIPEEWSREYHKGTVMESVSAAAAIVLFVGLIAAWIVTVVRVMRAARPKWRAVLLGAASMTLLAIVGMLNQWPTFSLDYETSVPLGSFMSSKLLESYFVGATALFALFFLLILSASMMNPNVFTAFRAANRRLLGRDALLSTGVCLGAVMLITGVERLVWTMIPAAQDWSGFDAPDVDVSSPALGLVANAYLNAMIWFLVAIIAQHMYRRYLTTRRKKVTLITAVATTLVLLAMGDSKSAGELIADLVGIGSFIALILLLWRFFWRENPLALLVGILVVLVADDTYQLWLGGSAYRTDLWISLLFLVLPLVYLAFESRGTLRKTAT
ncbi:MAG: CPBP family intramembrane metalloprotease [Candidatus Krumholzibacteria bacterium]|nr:CPBP family intramembrane metalloprotease [Candidatus Krumholzibacteria bacterium]